ncbi:unnamed protein product [Prorocentrum cordatum]|uniref:Uncharacterized protein n=1 Tax=Prorocentrum cordatum TaxID=2364126 RepID=A0ABN9P997_9DINO|nr:unnamed protein product [Polarella glacialis]
MGKKPGAAADGLDARWERRRSGRERPDAAGADASGEESGPAVADGGSAAARHQRALAGHGSRRARAAAAASGEEGAARSLGSAEPPAGEALALVGDPRGERRRSGSGRRRSAALLAARRGDSPSACPAPAPPPPPERRASLPPPPAALAAEAASGVDWGARCGAAAPAAGGKHAGAAVAVAVQDPRAAARFELAEAARKQRPEEVCRALAGALQHGVGAEEVENALHLLGSLVRRAHAREAAAEHVGREAAREWRRATDRLDALVAAVRGLEARLPAAGADHAAPLPAEQAGPGEEPPRAEVAAVDFADLVASARGAGAGGLAAARGRRDAAVAAAARLRAEAEEAQARACAADQRARAAAAELAALEAEAAAEGEEGFSFAHPEEGLQL